MDKWNSGKGGTAPDFLRPISLLRIMGTDLKSVPIIKKVYSANWARQGQAWGDESPADRMVEEMWAKYRKTLKAPANGWKRRK